MGFFKLLLPSRFEYEYGCMALNRRSGFILAFSFKCFGVIFTKATVSFSHFKALE